MNEVFLSGLRPKADLLRKTPGPYITSNIKLEQLPLYQQAALQTGYSLSVIAREGEPYTFLAPGSMRGAITRVAEPKTITIQPGFVAIYVEKPQDKIDFSPFWDAFKALNPTPPQAKYDVYLPH
ncbi:MAG: hypothetical protein UV61_C0028G0006 [Candidatus Gottesmanbacteria bacterium GW2011_GWB1_43_11]|uniref:Uncharacterized protein n=1 Tax=Candidatus Gottesmanbacteria bacterium GW2011_GWB1_43_11 TaxID=1618446 RepID=A0A0G1CFG0_9BACT|nr:MAG: hypothetical protein UV17_C0064G0003 [Candidatus Gottesmanbacteria bacterium GW2011_GWA1_42_26]KKS80577.1 MAG: hypothetical protein UV55_C0035G0007 [Candidatus Gottesmanbacteria bacterium GW2011_GWC1_43_10]KKS84545.1 MAG: hypothetical protein UV61_C0028G0006 [Candidatus Gottesmanbacteria bacterium GW2011_GWB1_43_11]OGG09659.1 MAG: hypothetical protein A2699_02830 [Candidatus Gottesmanbacteria bacterium RIFCSPHIGHO2_01_FULL_43_15]HCM37907.1 hypothetical protein [Patescibacteria group bac